MDKFWYFVTFAYTLSTPLDQSLIDTRFWGADGNTNNFIVRNDIRALKQWTLIEQFLYFYILITILLAPTERK